MNYPIQFEDVHRHFHRRAILRGLSFNVAPGEVYALLGRNGEGKTTAIRILLGFLEPTRGRVSILSVPSSRLRVSDRSRIGYVSEGQAAYEKIEMSLGEYVEMEAATHDGFDRGYVRSALRRYELDEGQGVRRLSRGQKAQVALLVAMAVRPDVLVLDDPAMGLDAVVRRDFLNVVIEYLVDAGSAVLFSSHILPDVERLADRVGILQRGRLLVDATVDDLKRRVQKVYAVDPVSALHGQAEGAADARRRRPVPVVDGLLRAQRQREGFELTLLDADGDVLRRLREQGFDPGASVVPSLEELFCDLTERSTDAELPAFSETD